MHWLISTNLTLAPVHRRRWQGVLRDMPSGRVQVSTCVARSQKFKHKYGNFQRRTMFGSVRVNTHAGMTGAGIDNIIGIGKDEIQDGITRRQEY